MAKDKPKIETTFSADEIKPVFQSLGIDIETIGFPCMEDRHNIPTMSYHTIFRDVKITPVKINEKVSTIITGKYETQAMANYQDSSGDWHPGYPSYYSFKIKEGKLNIK